VVGYRIAFVVLGVLFEGFLTARLRVPRGQALLPAVILRLIRTIFS
jgi:hypothetical protein